MAPTQVVGEVRGRLEVGQGEEGQEENASEHRDRSATPASEEVVE